MNDKGIMKKISISAFFCIFLLSSCGSVTPLPATIPTTAFTPTIAPTALPTARPTPMLWHWSNQMVWFNAMAVLPNHEVWTVGQSGLIAHDYLEYRELTNLEYVYYLEGHQCIDSVDFVSENDGWITACLGQIDHWDGKQWVNIIRPNLTSNIVFSDIKFVGKNDGYVVGCDSNISNDNLSKPIAMHWNGTNFENIFPSDSFGKDGFCLYQITVLADTDIWVAGGRYRKGVVFHWDGSSWQKIESSEIVNAVNSLSVVDDSNVWIASYDDIYSWDGKSWEHSKLPIWVNLPVAKSSTIFAVSDNNVWAGGRALYHWAGTEWENANYDERYGEIVDIKMTPDKELWALTSFGTVMDLGNQK